MSESDEKLSFSGDIMNGVKAAESALRRESVKILDNFVESGDDGDPLMQTAKAEKSNTGTLADLPEGHPLLAELIESQFRYEEKQEILTSRPNTDIKVRRAKRLNGAQVRRDDRNREIAEEERANDFVNAVNEKVDKAFGVIGEVMVSLDVIKDSVPDNRYAQLGIVRLERFLTATSRGLNGCRLRIGRS